MDVHQLVTNSDGRGWWGPTSCGCIDPGTLAVGTAELVWPPRLRRRRQQQRADVEAAPTDTLEHTRKEHTHEEHTHGYQEEQTQLLTSLNKTTTTPTNTAKDSSHAPKHPQQGGHPRLSRGTITDTSTMTNMRKSIHEKAPLTRNTQGTSTQSHTQTKYENTPKGGI